MCPNFEHDPTCDESTFYAYACVFIPRLAPAITITLTNELTPFLLPQQCNLPWPTKLHAHEPGRPLRGGDQVYRGGGPLQRGAGRVFARAPPSEPLLRPQWCAVPPANVDPDVEPHPKYDDSAFINWIFPAFAPLGAHFSGLVSCELYLVHWEHFEYEV